MTPSGNNQISTEFEKIGLRQLAESLQQVQGQDRKWEQVLCLVLKMFKDKTMKCKASP